MDKVSVEIEQNVYRQMVAMLEGRDLSDFLRDIVFQQALSAPRSRKLIPPASGAWPHMAIDALEYEDQFVESDPVKVLFDSNIIIDAMKLIPQAIQEIERYDTWNISLVTWIEIMTGAKTTAHEQELRQFLGQFRVFPIDEPIAEMAALVRRDYRLRLPDAMILATAKVAGQVLITRNSKDFGKMTTDIRIPYHL